MIIWRNKKTITCKRCYFITRTHTHTQEWMSGQNNTDVNDVVMYIVTVSLIHINDWKELYTYNENRIFYY